jgi:hypothetical protein
MQANPDKFQAIAVGKKTYAKEPVFNIESANISCDEVVKLLGIDIDYQLNFDTHIKNICRKASQQLSVLKRIVFFCFFLTKINNITIIHLIKRKALSCIFSSFIVFAFEQKCQAKGQKLKLDNIKE